MLVRTSQCAPFNIPMSRDFIYFQHCYVILYIKLWRNLLLHWRESITEVFIAKHRKMTLQEVKEQRIAETFCVAYGKTSTQSVKISEEGEMSNVNLAFVYKWHRLFWIGRNFIGQWTAREETDYWSKRWVTSWKVTDESPLGNLCLGLLSARHRFHNPI